MAFADFAGGSGTEAEPYQISTVGELFWFAEQENTESKVKFIK